MPLPRSIHLTPAVLIALSGAAFAEDERTIDQVPAPVATTLRAQANGAAIDDIEAKQHQGTTVYEAEIKKPDGKITLIVAAGGAVLRTEAKRDVTAMPAAVQAAVTKSFGDQAPKHGEVETTGSETTYTVEGTIGTDEVEVHFAADGAERFREIQKDEDHEDGAQKHDGAATDGAQHRHQDEDG